MVGGVSKTGAIVINPNPTTGISHVANPLSYLQPPPVGACDTTIPTHPIRLSCTANTSTGLSCTGAGSITLSQATYCGGITMAGATNVTLQSGTYVMNGGGLNIEGAATIASSGGVTIYLTGPQALDKGVNITGAVSGSLTAPTSGSLEGILFFQDPTISASTANANPNVINGATSSTINGALYFPTTALTYNGASGGGYTVIVADTITFNGASSTTVSNNYSSLANGSPIKSSALYE